MADLLVIGGGMAGLAGGAAAAEAGARVAVVEKSRNLGGSAAMSAGIVWTAPDYETLRRHARSALGRFVNERTKRRPMIVPVVIEV